MSWKDTFKRGSHTFLDPLGIQRASEQPIKQYGWDHSEVKKAGNSYTKTMTGSEQMNGKVGGDTMAQSIANMPSSAQEGITGVVAPPSTKNKPNPLAIPVPFDGGQVQQMAAPVTPEGFAAQSVQGAPVSFASAQIAPMPTAYGGATINTPSGAGSMSSFQAQLANQLALRASGQGPSVVDMQAAQARQQQQAAVMSQLASQRGQANPLAARTAMMANVQGGAQLTRDTMMNKINEQNQAQALLGQVSAQGRSQDIQQATSQAQMQQEAGLTAYKGQLDRAIAQGQLDQRTAESMFGEAQQNARLNAQMGQAFTDSKLKFAQMGMDVQHQNQMAALEVERLRQSGALGQAQINMQKTQANNQKNSGYINAGAGVLGTYVGGPKAGKAAADIADKTQTDYNTQGPDVSDDDTVDYDDEGQ